jgi:hypothetical protein
VFLSKTAELPFSDSPAKFMSYLPDRRISDPPDRSQILFYPGNCRKTDTEGLSCVVCDRFVVDVYIDLVADRNARTVIKEFLLDLIVDLAAFLNVSDSRSFCNELIDLLIVIVVI